MQAELKATSRLRVVYDSNGAPRDARSPVTASWNVSVAPEEIDLEGCAKLLLPALSTDRRLFLLVNPYSATAMSMLWDGLNAVYMPSLFVTTDNGYEVTADSVITPIAVTSPVAGKVRFWMGEDPDEKGVFPVGEPGTSNWSWESVP